jgi:high-affinity Fe2+/Pb2+ permease
MVFYIKLKVMNKLELNVIHYSYFSMSPRNRQLKLSNLDGFLGQINDNSSPDTKIKLLCRAANCLSRAGTFKNINKAIQLYTEASDIQSDIRGSSHSRTYHILNLIVKCETSMIILKKNRMETRLKSKLAEEAKKKKAKEMKEKKDKKEKKKAAQEGGWLGED